MDTLENLDAVLKGIRSDMPKTYAMIKEAAAKRPGIYKQVRSGLCGEAGCFYARERVKRPDHIEQWLVVGCRDDFVDLMPDMFGQGVDRYVDVFFFLPEQTAVQALARSKELQHAD